MVFGAIGQDVGIFLSILQTGLGSDYFDLNLSQAKEQAKSNLRGAFIIGSMEI